MMGAGCVTREGTVRVCWAGEVSKGASLVLLYLPREGPGCGVVVEEERGATASSSPSFSSVMVGGSDCAASIPRVVLVDRGVMSGGRGGLLEGVDS